MIIADEVYNLTSKVSKVLDTNSSLGRQRHALQRLEDTIFAFGGRLENGSETAVVSWFDWIDMAWKSARTDFG